MKLLRAKGGALWDRVDQELAWRTIDAQRLVLADLLDDLSAEEWATASLCRDWTVRDVAAHLTFAEVGAAPLLMQTLRARGDVSRGIRDAARRRAAMPVDQIGAVIRGMAGSRRYLPGVTPLESLVDVLVHTQDIARPLGRRVAMPAEGSAIAATSVWSSGWPFQARKRFAGLRLEATDVDWAVGRGREVLAPAGELLLLLTGRPVAVGATPAPGED